MKKIFRSKSIAVLVAVAMVFTISLSPAFAAEGSSDDSEAMDNNGENNVESTTSSSISLNSDHKNTYSNDTDISVKPDDDNGLLDEDDISVVWHFVLTRSENEDISDIKLHAEFENSGSITADAERHGDGGGAVHFYIGTSDHDTLIDAEATGVIKPDQGNTKLNLSHLAYDEVEPDPEGTLEITKEVNGEPGDIDDFEITIEGTGDVEYYEETEPISEDETISITLAPGTYKVWESDAQGADMVEYDGDIEDTNDDYVEVVISDDSTTELTVINTFEEPEDPEGILNIEKIIEDLSEELPGIAIIDPIEPEEIFEVTIESQDNDDTWVKEIEEGDNEFTLPEGSYTLWESETLGADPYYENDSDGTSDNEEIAFTIEDGEVTDIIITNTFPAEIVEGEIEIEKIVDGDGPEEYEVSMQWYPFLEGPASDDFDEGFVAAEMPELIQETITEGTNTFNLEPGLYHIWESDDGGADEVAYNGDIEDLDPPEAEEGVMVMVDPEGTTSISIINTFIDDTTPPPTPTPDPTGSITIEKILVMGDGVIEEIDQDFTVNVTDDDEYDEDHTLVVGEPLTINDLDLGTYTIEEVDIPEGFEFVEISDESVEITPGNLNPEVSVTNEMILDDDPDDLTGSINIEKILLDNGEEVSENDQEFTVNITNGDDYDEDHTFGVNDPLLVEDLDFDTYTIEEVDIPEGYELESISSDEVTLDEENQSVILFITNTVIPEEPTGNLTVEKALTNDEVSDDDMDQEFTVRITAEDGSEEEYTFSVNDPAEISGLELGTYQVEEVNLPTGYGFESISESEVTFTEDLLDITVVIENSIAEEDIDDLDPPEGPEDDVDEPDDEDEDIILDEETPLGTDELPRTGQYHHAVYAVLGLMITSFGVFLKRRLT
ncbi:MSCRAMM family protein [Isachenkonia alkalipeptolytica]|uniref:DUF5979 domain-containing protein n=1 Tax=Isachenkonia alkalipeptolytica TaxID=2565777 RepID=A0AA43XM43_9CLOT|nr:DUF5979 domain-containing protein [Isachenkonia alkalipeptolytica]NBG88864.1 hypothetical protein [Isachenkonia alkalipeptolytica]